MTLTVKHASLTGAAANPNVLVDGPKWDADHTITGTLDTSQLPSTAVTGPGSATLGNIAYFSNVSGNQISAAISFQAGNPGKAALYSQVANVADGYTTPNNGLQVSIGTAMGATEQFGNNPVVLPGDHPGQQQAVVGTAQSSATDTGGNVWGVVGYARANSANVNAIGTGGHGAVNVTNGNAWGMNAVVHNQSAIATNGGFNANWMSAAEFDVNIWKKAAGAEPTIGNLFGVYVYGSGDSTTSQGYAFATDGLNASTGAKWSYGFASRGGASINAFVAGPTAKTGNNLSSQNVLFQSTNGAGATINSTMLSDGSGNLIVLPNSGKLGLGSTNLAPDAALTINANTVVGTAPTANLAIHLVSADSSNTGIQMDTFGTSSNPLVSGRFARNTSASKAVPQSGDVFLNIQGQGYDTSAYSTGARTQYRASETWSASAHGSEYAIAVVANTTTTLTDALTVKNSGGVAIGTAADPGTGGLGASGLIKSSSPTAGVGYATGAGGTVTQATSKSTGVTLNVVCGQITMNNAALASGTMATFTLTNSAIAATDCVMVWHQSAGTVGSYLIFPQSAAGSATINVLNRSAGSLSEAIVLGFVVVKAVTS
jgi:hypothetical protein